MRVQASFFDRKLHFTLKTMSPLLNILGFLLHHLSLIISTSIHTTLLQLKSIVSSYEKLSSGCSILVQQYFHCALWNILWKQIRMLTDMGKIFLLREHTLLLQVVLSCGS